MANIENEKSDDTIYILDSYGLIYRCYFAFISRPLTNSKGQNISALFGFFRNLHYIFNHYKPSYLVAAMDSKTKTFRHEMYPEYKATRDKTPEDLHAQIPWICDILQALGVPVLQCDGYEADDIVATVAKKCEAMGRKCRILSGDKDLMQLVCDTTQILKPEAGSSTWKVTGAEGVKAEWGVYPDKLLDLLSLCGDKADNVPGVKGIGDKTASKLLCDFGSLDGIYENIDNIKGAVQKKLIEGKENAYFSQKLITLYDKVECPEIEKIFQQGPIFYDFDAAAKLLNSYEAFQVAKNYAVLNVETNGDLKSQNNSNSPVGEIKPDGESKAGGNDFVRNGGEHNDSQAVAERIKPEPEQNDTSAYKAITDYQQLKDYIDMAIAAKIVAYDSETDSLDPLHAKMIGFSLCFEEKKAVYVPVQLESDELFSQTDYIPLSLILEQLYRLFTAENVTIVMHNAKFDLKVLAGQFISQGKNETFVLDFLQKIHIFDTMIFAWLENPEHTGKSSFSLEFLGENLLGKKGIEFDQIVKKGQTFADVPLETAYKYAAEDADFTFQLYHHFIKNSKISSELFEMEMTVLPILTQMEISGIHLDSQILNDYAIELKQKISEVEKKIYNEVGHEFNIASPLQLQTVLFEERGLKTGKKTKRGYSTDTSVLEELQEFDIVPKMILEYRELTKLLSTYVESLPKLTDKESRIHTDFVQTGTATGRLSCRDPNLQNIPVRNETGRKIRSAFTAENGKVLISADYAQIELVVLAHLSGDENMCRAFNEGTDVHKTTAALIYGVSPDQVTPQMRRIAKTINFGVIYGMGTFSLSKDLGISRKEAQNFIDLYFKTYSSVSQFMSDTISKAESNGYVETIFNRRRPIASINSKNKIEKASAERIAKNTPIQGSAADIVKKAMIDVSKTLKESGLPCKILLQVHDELIFECDEDEKIIQQAISLIKEKMENAVKLKVPLRVSIEYGKNWGEFH